MILKINGNPLEVCKQISSDKICNNFSHDQLQVYVDLKIQQYYMALDFHEHLNQTLLFKIIKLGSFIFS